MQGQIDRRDWGQGINAVDDILGQQFVVLVNPDPIKSGAVRISRVRRAEYILARFLLHGVKLTKCGGGFMLQETGHRIGKLTIPLCRTVHERSRGRGEFWQGFIDHRGIKLYTLPSGATWRLIFRETLIYVIGNNLELQ
ncbi:MAG: hypothetical protein HOM25_06815 [Rhodospirillaceae bacterium]|nr:hypothetical protein [Rhodospirillaceae bacterium]MBT5667771.1 hypothetical protein [Rhodospirillaceae bacterium]MBT5810024.1 hypothetical protein [Rhodospirillaceae bacterium]